MALKDLRSKKKVKAKIALNSYWLKPNGLKLLEDKRPKLVKIQEGLRKESLRLFMALKAKEHPLCMAHQLALQFVERKVSLKKNLWHFPYYQRGVKGYLLDNSAVNLFPAPEQKAFKEQIEKFDVQLAWFPHTILTLPKEYYRILKTK